MSLAQDRLREALIAAGLSQDKIKTRMESYSGWNNGYSRNDPSSMICPNCRSRMVDVTLIGSRKARYCPCDRVVVPYPVVDDNNEKAVAEFIQSVTSPNKETASMFATTEEPFEREYNH